MTDFELYTLAAKFMELNFIAASLFATILFGFLVMAYTVGAKLTRPQLWLVVPTYLSFISLLLYGAMLVRASVERFLPVNWRARGDAPLSIIDVNNPFATPHLAMLVAAVVIAGSLLFLRDVRKKAAMASGREKRQSLASRARMMRGSGGYGSVHARPALRRLRQARLGGRS